MLDALLAMTLGAAAAQPAPRSDPAPASRAPAAAAGEWTEPSPATLQELYGVAWKVDLGGFELLATNLEQWTRPVIGEDGSRVFIGTRDGRLEGRSLEDGRLLWARNDLGALGADMVEHRGTLHVGVGSDLVGFDGALGQERGRVELGGGIGGPIARTGTVAIVPVRPNAFIAVDLVAGKKLWQAKRPTPDGLTVRGQARATIDARRGVAYLGFSDGALIAAALADGTSRWVAALGNPSEYFADVDAAPILVDGGQALLTAAYNTGLFRLDAATGAVAWTRDVPRLIALASSARGVVVAAHGEGQLLGIDPSKGEVLWRYRMKGGSPSQPRILSGDRAAVTTSQGAMSIVSIIDGRPLQLVAPGTGSSVPPAVLGDDLVLLSNGGLVLALRRTTRGTTIIR